MTDKGPAAARMVSAKRLRALWWMTRAKFHLRRCTSVGARTRLLNGRPRIVNRGSIVLGRHVVIMSAITAVELQAVEGGRIEIGDRTFLNYGVSISAHQLVRLGCDCLLSNYVAILDNDWHDILDRHRVPASRPVILEDNVWLGVRVIVLPGVTIGHDTVVGAGSVVVKSLPPRSIAVGNPLADQNGNSAGSALLP